MAVPVPCLNALPGAMIVHRLVLIKTVPIITDLPLLSSVRLGTAHMYVCGHGTLHRGTARRDVPASCPC